MDERLRNKVIAAGASCILLILVLVLALTLGNGSDKKKLADTSAGISFIRNQEASGVDAVRDIIQAQREAKMKDECAQRIEILENDNNKAWSMFEDYLFFGDSRCVELVYAGFLPESNCVVEYGVNILNHLEPNLNVIEETKPSYLYLEYGVNDIGCGNWSTGDTYAADYGRIMDIVHSISPKTKVYVNSTLLAYGAAFDRYDGFKYIPDWNENIRQMCAERDFCYYIDNDYICEQYSWMYQEDGIHVIDDFYPIWAANMMICQYEFELQEQLNSVSQGDGEYQEDSGEYQEDGGEYQEGEQI